MGRSDASGAWGCMWRFCLEGRMFHVPMAGELVQGAYITAKELFPIVVALAMQLGWFVAR